jgi:hypothetical protein
VACADCNGNNIPDEVDIADGMLDERGCSGGSMINTPNGVPDYCDAADCDCDLIADVPNTDIDCDDAEDQCDCNLNGIDDACDFMRGVSECMGYPGAPPEPTGIGPTGRGYTCIDVMRIDNVQIKPITVCEWNGVDCSGQPCICDTGDWECEAP